MSSLILKFPIDASLQILNEYFWEYQFLIVSFCGFIVSLAVEPSKAFDFHALTMCLALSSVVNCNGDLRFASLIFVWYYFLYDDWSMYVVYDFSNLVLVEGLALVNCFVRLTMIHRVGSKLADWWFFCEVLLGFGVCG